MYHIYSGASLLTGMFGTCPKSHGPHNTDLYAWECRNRYGAKNGNTVVANHHSALKNNSCVIESNTPTPSTKTVVNTKCARSEYSRSMCLSIGLNVNNSNAKHINAKQCKFDDNREASSTAVNNAAFIETVHLNSRFTVSG